MKRKKNIKSRIFTNYQAPELLTILQQGGIGVLPTDTIYGLVTSALNPEAVGRLYRLKARDTAKPSIILIGDIKQLDLFGISEADKRKAGRYWPGPISLVLACHDKAFSYLHHGTNSLAFRLPDNQQLWELLERSGPLVAPSANPQSKKPAQTIAEAQHYFGDKVDFYVDGGKLSGKPSKLISLLNKTPKILRD